MMLSLAFAAAGLLLSVIKIVYEVFFSPSAKLTAWQKWAAEGKARADAAAATLKKESDAIDAQPPSSGQDLVDKLNKDITKK